MFVEWINEWDSMNLMTRLGDKLGWWLFSHLTTKELEVLKLVNIAVRIWIQVSWLQVLARFIWWSFLYTSISQPIVICISPSRFWQIYIPFTLLFALYLSLNYFILMCIPLDNYIFWCSSMHTLYQHTNVDTSPCLAQNFHHLPLPHKHHLLEHIQNLQI